MDRKANILFEKIIQGDRTSLGLAMTLVESERETDRSEAIQLLGLCEHHLEQKSPVIRFAISGAPGAGKSTLIEALGLKAISHGHTIGVITVDPTSTISHGSILGDKSRMNALSVSPSAFIRTSAAGTVLGGISRRSHELMTLLAAAGYSMIFMETVGVGQSEHLARQLTDGFVLVIQPGSGDELQGIKRGITELADIIVVNKADGAMEELAKTVKNQYQNAIHYFSSLRSTWQPKLVTCSALTGKGIDDFWDLLRLYQEQLSNNTSWAEERNQQKLFWLRWSLGLTANHLLTNHPAVKEKLDEINQSMHQKNVSLFQHAYQIEEMMKSLIIDSKIKSEK